MNTRPIREDTTTFVIHGAHSLPGSGWHVEDINKIHERRKDFKVKKIGYHRFGPEEGEFESGEDIDRVGEHVGWGRTSKISVAWCLAGGRSLADQNRARAEEIEWNEVGWDNNYPPEQMNLLFRDLSHHLDIYPNAVRIVGHNVISGPRYPCPGFDVIAWTKTNGLWEFLQARKVSLKNAL